MTIPLWVLLAFALWTVGVLIATVGTYRWQRILTGRAPIREFRHDHTAHQQDWYRRAMRAHGNCVENLPVFGAVVLILSSLELDTLMLDLSALVFIVARVCQTSVHVAFAETNRTVAVRFAFFFVQLVVVLCMSFVIIASTV